MKSLINKVTSLLLLSKGLGKRRRRTPFLQYLLLPLLCLALSLSACSSGGGSDSSEGDPPNNEGDPPGPPPGDPPGPPPAPVFDSDSYDFSVLSSSVALRAPFVTTPSLPAVTTATTVGTVAATPVNGESPTYALPSCPGFEIDSDSGVITPAVGTPNDPVEQSCMVSATAMGETRMVPISLSVRVLCQADVLPPNNRDTLPLGPEDPTDNTRNCGGWEVKIAHPGTATENIATEIRAYRFRDLTPGKNYNLRVQLAAGGTYPNFNLTDVRHQQESFLTPNTGSPVRIVPGSVPANIARAVSDISISGTEYHINFERVIRDSEIIVTLLPVRE